jgi:amino acid transporter
MTPAGLNPSVRSCPRQHYGCSPTHIHSQRCNVQEPTDIYFTPPSAEQFVKNLSWEFTDKNDLTTVLALVYTTTCGIMVGANLSGDLKNPGESLPKGTLLAMLTSCSTYVVFASVLAATFDRRSLQCEWLVLQKASGKLSYVAPFCF